MLSVDGSILEDVEVLGVCLPHELVQGVLEAALLLAVQAPIFEVVDRHQDSGQVTNLGQLLGARLLRLTLKFVLLVFYPLELLLQLCNLIVELHDVSLHVLLILNDLVFETVQLALKLGHLFVELLVGVLEGLIAGEDVLKL